MPNTATLIKKRDNIMGDETLTVQQVAKFLQLNEITVLKRLIHTKELPAFTQPFLVPRNVQIRKGWVHDSRRMAHPQKRPRRMDREDEKKEWRR